VRGVLQQYVEVITPSKARLAGVACSDSDRDDQLRPNP
jgi:hypothetical protein